jgi:hypothetical protein
MERQVEAVMTQLTDPPKFQFGDRVRIAGTAIKGTIRSREIMEYRPYDKFLVLYHAGAKLPARTWVREFDLLPEEGTS